VGVVFGSMSPEHEISVITACQAMPVLSELGATVIPIYITKGGSWITDPSFVELQTFRQQLPEKGDAIGLDLAAGSFRIGSGSLLGRPRELEVDVLFPMLHGGHGEDGTLAALATLARIPQAGSGTLAGALGMDKFRSKQLLQALGLPVVPAGLADTAAQASGLAQQAGYPLVVKPNRSGSSIGVTLVASEEELAAAVELAFTVDSEVVVERAVAGAQDLNCAVKSAPPRASEVERPFKGDGVLSYTDKYVGGAGPPEKSEGHSGKAKGDSRRELPAIIPAELRSRCQELAVRSFDALGCRGAARVDFLYSDQGELFVNEVNTLPGSLGFYLWEATGVGFPALLEELVREGLTPLPPHQPSLPGNLLASGELLGK
jgi:D-alanine-D-alanine ligase